MTSTPQDPSGYKVNVATGQVHRRYADHAPTATRTKTWDGVLQLLPDRTPEACTVCWPAKATRKPPVRRAAPVRKQPIHLTPIVPDVVEPVAQLPELENGEE